MSWDCQAPMKRSCCRSGARRPGRSTKRPLDRKSVALRSRTVQARATERHTERYLVRPEHGPILAQLYLPARSGGSHQDHREHREHRDHPHSAREWDFGPFSYIRSLRLGPSAERDGFRCHARGGQVGSLLHAVHYSDEFSGVSGGVPEGDSVVAHVIRSGWARFENGTESVTVRPGQVVFRDTAKPWRFWFGPATRSRTVVVPRDRLVRHAAVPGRLPQVVVADTDLAEVRLLTGFLDLARRLGDDTLSPLGRSVSEDVGIQLLAAALAAAMGAARSAETGEHSNVVLAAARRFIDERLDDPSLAPGMIAQALHVSPRTLHRAFEDADESVMAYTRRRRLGRARIDLMTPGARVADVAARWSFSDTSHFLRHFKAAYGTTPTAFVKEHREPGVGGVTDREQGGLSKA
ncbi:helix-turn-helix domain-containing protein [Streptomyces sp. NPDC091280]|uniref:helix-turn-helix domain-containing protein n=1 Tax=Streptomyces sp. NPDC091280 TaxID=3365984 RepID=UPI0038105750